MKDLAVLRGIILMLLLLVSMYLVFSSVTDKMGNVDEDQNIDDSDLASLLEDFEVLTSQPESVKISSGRFSYPQQWTPGDVSGVLQKQIIEGQNFADRKHAKAALLESVRNGEANRLLERVSKPLIEKQDISIQGVLPEKSQLADSLEALAEDLASATRIDSVLHNEKDSGEDLSPDQESQ
ncbi:MAG: hypothetical protein HOD72_14185 [Opitutae bacterium]|jgi:hypothetical protein|nr:hypothetical protein [Opitutae bacterium]MBT5378920.1 hypothetical protein [Opitutae bacterium]MBT5689752.1 hypothetical protein [Opitutae bacterium]MBT6463583.1 hypothetical protein [Opitutae bacterium]MBT7852785.1 hypothetical protein [Opitutae bacterium]